jgi:hypothetical protein
LAFSVAAAAAVPERVVTTDPHSQPESLTVAPDGSLILGSASKPVIYRAAKGDTEAHVFIDTSSEGAVTFLGVLADAPTNTLWACQIVGVGTTVIPPCVGSILRPARPNSAGRCPARSISATISRWARIIRSM